MPPAVRVQDGHITAVSYTHLDVYKRQNFRIALFHSIERGKGIGTWATELTRGFAFEKLKLIKNTEKQTFII